MDIETDIRRAMEDDMGEPSSPKEIAQYKVEMATRDAWLASAELFRLCCDPIAKEFFTPRVEADLWSVKSRIDTIISDLRAGKGELPLPRPALVYRR